MSNTLDVIKYGLETLKVTPKELFSLIESSNGYSGDNYSRWLANEIIKLAEKDGIGYSHLLAKWFNLIQGIIEEYSDDSIKSEYIDKIKSMLGDGEVYTIGLSKDNPFGEDLSEVDWFDSVDLPFNFEFLSSLPNDIGDKILEGSDVTFFFKSNSKNSFKKSSQLFLDSRLNKIDINSADALMFYRMCAMARVLDTEDVSFKFAFMVDTEFLFNEENRGIIDCFLSYFDYEGFVVSSKEFYEGSFTSEDYAICVCSFRHGSSDNGIKLRSVKVVDNEIVYSKRCKRYSFGGDMFDYLRGDVVYSDNVPLLSREYARVGKTKGLKSALGYLCKGDIDRNPIISSFPVEGTDFVAITKANLPNVIAYFGVMVSRDSSGLFSGISEIVDGNPDYNSLVGNCLPVFLFDVNMKCSDMGIIETKSGAKVHLANKLDVSSDVIKNMIDTYSVYFSYEAKELFDVCLSLIDYFREHSTGDLTGITFEALRESCEDDNLNKSYISALTRCKGYINSTFKSLYM